MLQINGHVLNIDDYFVVDDYDGNDYIEFDISVDAPEYKQITERALINSEENDYLITKIDGSSNRYVHVSADVDKRAFQTVFYENYDNGSKKLTEAVNAFLPSGWAFVNNGNTTNYRTLRLEAGTALDLLNNCAALYNVRFRFNAKSKTLTAVNPASYEQDAAFVTEELNLRKLQYYGDASEFITRLEARGKDGMTFASINDNKSYVENYSYSTDIVYGYWKDERYTVKEDLLAAAQEKLAELSFPKRSYECDVIDLKSIDPEKYSAFDLSLYQRISLKDVSRETEHTYQVVKVRNYPNYPEKNVVTLSTTAPTLTAKLQEVESEVNDLDIEVAKNNTSWLTDSEGGYIYFIRDSAGNITEQVLKVGEGDDPPVWVFNKNGIGFSADGIGGAPIISMTSNGAFSAIKSFQLIDSNGVRRASMGYSVTDFASLYLFNADGTNTATCHAATDGGLMAVGNNSGTTTATMQAYSNGGLIAVKNNSGTTTATMQASSNNGGLLAISNANGARSVQAFTGQNNDGTINVHDSTGNITINLSGTSGVVTCVNVNQTSSREVKTNIQPIEDAEKILELEAVSFDYKNKSLGTDKRGFIAEDVAEILPNLVTHGTETTPTTLDYISMIPYIQAVVKSQEARIKALENARDMERV